jgi:hypothetical protein
MWATRDLYSQERLDDKARHLSVEDKETLKNKLQKICVFYAVPVCSRHRDGSKIWIGSENGWDEDMIPLEETANLDIEPGEGPVEIIVTFRKKDA